MAKAPDANAKVGQETYFDKYGIPYTPFSRAQKYLEMYMKTNRKRGVICLISEAGEGKTQMIQQLAKKYERRVVDIRTANYALVGAGVPQRANDKGFFNIAVPEFFPQPNEKTVLLFDEVNQGLQHAINMFFPLMEDRILFNYKLPDECLIIALMNPATAQYAVSKIETLRAFNRRLKKFYIWTPYAEWEKHAKTTLFHASDGMEKPCHPWVVKYLNTARNCLYDRAAADKGQQFACPATWQTVSLDLYMLEQENIELYSEEATDLIAASIGNLQAKSLTEYIKNNEIRIAPEEVLEKYKPNSKLRRKIQELVKEEGGGIPDLCENIAQYLFDHKDDINADNVAPCLALFWSDLPDELAQGFFTQLSSAAQSTGDEGSTKKNVNFMKELTNSLLNEDAYVEVNKRLHSSFDSFSRALAGKKGKGKDPMSGDDAA